MGMLSLSNRFCSRLLCLLVFIQSPCCPEQGPNLGKGGIDTTPSSERSAPQPPPQFQKADAPNPEQLSRSENTKSIDPWYPEHESDAAQSRGPGAQGDVDKGSTAEMTKEVIPLGPKYQTPEQIEASVKAKLLPRETGHDIGMGSPVPLSKEAVDVITKLRNMKVRTVSLQALSSTCPPSAHPLAHIGRGRRLVPLARCRVQSEGKAPSCRDEDQTSATAK